MKHTGCRFEYEEERGKELLRTFKTLIGQSSEIDLGNIYKQLVLQPSSRFWVSGERAAIVISDIVRGKDTLRSMKRKKREMYEEIFRRFEALRKRMPEKTIQELAFIIVYQGAPQFFMEPETARMYVQNAKRKRLEETKQRLNHCFWMPRK